MLNIERLTKLEKSQINKLYRLLMEYKEQEHLLSYNTIETNNPSFAHENRVTLARLDLKIHSLLSDKS